MSNSIQDLMHDVAIQLCGWLRGHLPTSGDPQWWNERVIKVLSGQQRYHVENRNITTLDELDVGVLLHVFDKNWDLLRKHAGLEPEFRNCLREMREIRNCCVGHLSVRGVPVEDQLRYVDTMRRFVTRLVSSSALVQCIETEYERLLQWAARSRCPGKQSTSKMSSASTPDEPRSTTNETDRIELPAQSVGTGTQEQGLATTADKADTEGAPATKGTENSLTAQQQEACCCLEAFVESDKRAFILQGYAGTGKTYLIGHMARELIKQNHAVFLLAPTGRAARVLEQKTGINAATVHRCVYNLNELVEHDDENARFKFYFQLKEAADDDLDVVYFVDEASMVSDKESEQEFLRFGSGRLLADLIEFARLAQPKQPSKVVFVGDPAQLPPVNSGTSPALDCGYLQHEHGIACEGFELTEVVRHEEGSAILRQATVLRDTLNTGFFNSLSIDTTPGEIEEIRPTDVPRLYLEGTRDEASNSLVCITYTNQAALDYNRMIRNALYESECDLPVQAGDVLMVVNSNRRFGLLNGDLVRVLDVSPDNEHRKVRVGQHDVILDFREVEIGFEGASGTLSKGRCKIVENVLFNTLRDIAPAEQKALYVDFKVRHPNLKPNTADFTSNLLNDAYFNALRVKFGYAVTCHKAQGGEWDRSIVLFENHRTDAEALRWAYTAITRARRTLYGINVPHKQAWDGVLTQAGTSTGELDIATDEDAERVLKEIEEEAKLQEPAVTTTDSPPPAFPDEPAFLKAKHEAVSAAFADQGINVDGVDVRPDKYYFRYSLSRGGACTRLQIYFNKKEQFTVSVLPTVGDAGNLGADATRIFDGTSAGAIAQAQPELTFPSDKPFLRAFYQQGIRPRTENTGASVVSVQHLSFRERYHFAGEQGCATIDFIYDGRGRFTQREIVDSGTTSKALAESILGDTT